MIARPPVYGTLLAVFAGSALIGATVPVTSILREISAIPALGALFAAVFQVFRDQAAFERNWLLQQQQQAFSLGAASHMAAKAFDKHAEFCEHYMAEVHLTVATFFREGPTEKALSHSTKLVELRGKYSAWLPRRISDDLAPFEAALRKIGASSYLVNALSGTGDPGYSKAVREMYDTFNEVLLIGETYQDAAKIPDVAIQGVEQRLRSILGIEQLSEMRQRLTDKALAFVLDGASPATPYK